MDVVLIYVTAKDSNEAKSIGQTLVEEKLVACANIIDNMTSFYRWDDKVQEDKEAILILKSSNHNVERITNRIKDLHSYECPCVLTIPISGGNQNYLEWIHNNSTSET